MVYRPGTSCLDGRTFNPHHHGFNQYTRPGANANTGYWLLATLNIYETAPQNVLDPQADAIVQTKNFISKEALTRSCKLIDSKTITIKKIEHPIAFSLHNRQPSITQDHSAPSQTPTSPEQRNIPNSLVQTGFDDEDNELSDAMSAPGPEQSQEEAASFLYPDKQAQAESIKKQVPSTTDNRCTTCGTQLSRKRGLQRHLQNSKSQLSEADGTVHILKYSKNPVDDAFSVE